MAAGIRLRDERDHSAKVLAAQQVLHDKEIADERELADERLTRQLEHSAAQLAAERKADDRLKAQLQHSDAQLHRERQNAQDAEQLAEAWAVQVALTLWNVVQPGVAPDPSVKKLVIMVINYSARTITRAEAQFSSSGQTLILHQKSEYLSAPPGSSGFLQPDSTGSASVLMRGTAARFTSDPVAVAQIDSPYPVVRWTDWLGQRWEHRRGEVRKIDDDAPWVP